MGDIFLEYIVKQKPNGKTFIYRAGIILAAIILILLALSLAGNQLISYFLPAIIIGVGYASYKFYTGLNFEFEYIVTNGELDIDRIAAKRTRARLFSTSPKEIEVLAPLDEKYKDKYENGEFAKTIDASSSKTSPDRWFLIANTKKHGRVRVIFEPTEKMVENMRHFIPDKVFTK